MKRITFVIAFALAVGMSLTAYGAGAHLDSDDPRAERDVNAVCTEDVPWNIISVDENGKGVTQLPDGVSVEVENADAEKRLVIDLVTEQEALDWINGVVGEKSQNTVAYHIYYIDGDRILPAENVKVSILCDKEQAHSVTSEGAVNSLECDKSDTKLTFTTDGAPFYVLGENVQDSSSDTSSDSSGSSAVDKDNSSQTGSQAQNAGQTANNDGDKTPNTGLAAGAMSLLLLGGVAVVVSKKLHDK